jgi:hypothetical protein
MREAPAGGDRVVGDIRRDFTPLERRFVHESQLRSTGDAKEIRACTVFCSLGLLVSG